MKQAISVVAAALLVVGSLTGCGLAGQQEATSEGQQEQQADFNQADMDFALAMQGHHQQALRMADMVKERSDHPQLNNLADKITATQAPEVDLFARWIRAWAKRGAEMPAHDHSSTDHGPGTMSERQISRLDGARGTKFDLMFLKMMIDHHQGAITMARTEIDQGANAEAKELAREIKQAQAGEIARMRRLLTQL